MAYVAPVIAASGFTFTKLQQGGPSAHLEALITANSTATAAPSAAPTIAVSGSGGLLGAGAYFLKITETNGIGETTASPESLTFSVTAGQVPTVTFPALQTGNTARNVYLTAAGGATGTEVLYATGVTTGTKTLAVAAPSNSYAVNPPTTNTTAISSNVKLQLSRYAKTNQFQKVWDYFHNIITNFSQGEPVAYNQVMTKHRDAHVVFAMLNTMANESGTLLDANSGTIVSSATPIGGSQKRRVWP